jgi:hypothetical protein
MYIGTKPTSQESNYLGNFFGLSRPLQTDGLPDMLNTLQSGIEMEVPIRLTILTSLKLTINYEIYTYFTLLSSIPMSIVPLLTTLIRIPVPFN